MLGLSKKESNATPITRKMKMYEDELKAIIERVKSADENMAEQAQKRWDSVAHPLGGLGLFESAIIDIAACQSRLIPDISKKAVAVFCADNGIVAEGVSQTGQEVSAIVAKNMCTGQTSVCNMAKVANADVFPVDIGLLNAVDDERITDLCVRRGTADFLKEDAMSREEAAFAMVRGANFAKTLIEKGYNLLATGEMGIGNTTTSTAVACALLGLDANSATGRGAGLCDEGLEKKRKVISEGLKRRNVDKTDALGVVAKVGGLDIAAMAGFFIEAAGEKRCVLIDGFISAVAALVAVRLCPACNRFLIATHESAEPAFQAVLSALEKKAFIRANMHLGEGTGAVMAFPMLDMALSVYKNMATFSEINVEAYKR